MITVPVWLIALIILYALTITALYIAIHAAYDACRYNLKYTRLLLDSAMDDLLVARKRLRACETNPGNIVDHQKQTAERKGDTTP